MEEFGEARHAGAIFGGHGSIEMPGVPWLSTHRFHPGRFTKPPSQSTKRQPIGLVIDGVVHGETNAENIGI